MQAHLSESRPGFWFILGAVFVAGWVGGAAAALLWALLGCYAVLDVLSGARPVRGRAA